MNVRARGGVLPGMRQGAPKCRRHRAVSLLADGGLSPRRAARIRRHLETCDSCRALQRDLAALGRWVGSLGGLEDLAPESFISVHLAVRARIRGAAAPPAGARAARPAWAVLAPLAGVLAMAAVLLSGGGRQVPTGVVPAMGADDGKIIYMSPLEDVSAALLTIKNGPGMEHRVAVSSQGPEFAHARIYTVTGDRWIDPTPAPPPGQVIFYRVD